MKYSWCAPLLQEEEEEEVVVIRWKGRPPGGAMLPSSGVKKRATPLSLLQRKQTGWKDGGKRGQVWWTDRWEGGGSLALHCWSALLALWCSVVYCTEQRQLQLLHQHAETQSHCSIRHTVASSRCSEPENKIHNDRVFWRVSVWHDRHASASTRVSIHNHHQRWLTIHSLLQCTVISEVWSSEADREMDRWMDHNHKPNNISMLKEEGKKSRNTKT